MSTFPIPSSAGQGAHIPNMLQRKEATAGAFAQGLAELLLARGLTRKEISAVLQGLQETGMIARTVTVPKVISALGQGSTENTDSSQKVTSATPPTTLNKFREQNQVLTHLTHPILPPNLAEAHKNGLYRTALMFYSIIVGARGPKLDTRKPTVSSWIKEQLQRILGSSPTSENVREHNRLNKSKGWNTPAQIFPPPFNPEKQKDRAILFLKDYCHRMGLSLPDESLIAENAIAFYFSQSVVLTQELFTDLYQGIMSLRLKFENALLHPESSVEFSIDEIKKLSTYMNVVEHDVRNMIEQRQEAEFALTKNHLILLEYAHQSLLEVYNSDNGISMNPNVDQYNALQDLILSNSEAVMDGKHPNIEYGGLAGGTTPTKTPEAGPTATGTSNA